MFRQSVFDRMATAGPYTVIPRYDNNIVCVVVAVAVVVVVVVVALS